MKAIIENPIFSVMITFLVFYLASKLYNKYRFILFNPVLISITSLILLLKLINLDYHTYFKGAKIISFFLGPSVVALGVPLYLQFEEIKKRGISIIISIIIGSIVGILSAALTAKLLGASKVVVASIAPKSVTTPIAMGISKKIGGIPSLTAAIVIATGVLGAVIGPAFLKLTGIKNKVAVGLAIGSASHGIGTARAFEEGELEGASSSLAICLNGIATAIFTPIIFYIIYKLL
ncbi:LrgB family protein [Deferribacter desulfuricans SSM1]|uniref:LrgB family protein n=1 Tax=Deferribacter desulfuricans (strain DSM 14783 / JCM 11476 / NBRC 101012 / SSM1) TaxID=639282 RepID=D3PBS0_DEFDS|nr:CidB/LrgB family autolysis modulator [Deferribacter desulfuricans]BAI80043.1 LrgB family protein [Deferribacter desulfuricans SSM1]